MPASQQQIQQDQQLAMRAARALNGPYVPQQPPPANEPLPPYDPGPAPDYEQALLDALVIEPTDGGDPNRDDDNISEMSFATTVHFDPSAHASSQHAAPLPSRPSPAAGTASASASPSSQPTVPHVLVSPVGAASTASPGTPDITFATPEEQEAADFALAQRLAREQELELREHASLNRAGNTNPATAWNPRRTTLSAGHASRGDGLSGRFAVSDDEVSYPGRVPRPTAASAQGHLAPPAPPPRNTRRVSDVGMARPSVVAPPRTGSSTAGSLNRFPPRPAAASARDDYLNAVFGSQSAPSSPVRPLRPPASSASSQSRTIGPDGPFTLSTAEADALIRHHLNRATGPKKFSLLTVGCHTIQLFGLNPHARGAAQLQTVVHARFPPQAHPGAVASFRFLHPQGPEFATATFVPGYTPSWSVRLNHYAFRTLLAQELVFPPWKLKMAFGVGGERLAWKKEEPISVAYVCVLYPHKQKVAKLDLPDSPLTRGEPRHHPQVRMHARGNGVMKLTTARSGQWELQIVTGLLTMWTQTWVEGVA
ncbi:hypothetical protein CXG81DRAFT_28627 [Caulochytrium protostelioides]|uniref:Uncharacterized protein n=1 Tax=Caulochytrium protostelioides TaxID=1555241 RepID=A0A4P9X2J4_9FUNG|nr:hypothetical protein CXG81DRAFT_28627 [Caulochytrium protostelioides]|eukprot:RKO98556.1 hypothetical protein CXG81DRAFT_28627 [Caulochytrium protostelioides]